MNNCDQKEQMQPQTRFGKEILPITVCDGIFNLLIIKGTSDFCQIILHDKRCSMQFCMVYQIKLNVHLLYSFIHVFIYNSITKCFWQQFCQTFGKGV